ncbi:MAG: NUDIX domain-containing protein [Micrococcales bacterium]|nr:NUDIX domain-containing protein [Micrococcales bacterium]
MPLALVPASYVYLLRSTPDGDEVLLQQRADTGYMDGHWVSGAAGHVEPGETAVLAAVREAEEELGVRVAPADLTLLTVMQRRRGEKPIEQRVDWFWSARVWEGEPRIVEPHKCSGLAWFPFTALPEPIPGYEQIVLCGIETGELAPATAWGFD